MLQTLKSYILFYFIHYAISQLKCTKKSLNLIMEYINSVAYQIAQLVPAIWIRFQLYCLLFSDGQGLTAPMKIQYEMLAHLCGFSKTTQLVVIVHYNILLLLNQIITVDWLISSSSSSFYSFNTCIHLFHIRHQRIQNTAQ